MTYIELLPAVLSLSRSDKLRLIRVLAEDLIGVETSLSMSTEGERLEEGRVADGRAQEFVPPLVTRNVIDSHGESGSVRASKDGVVEADQTGAPLAEISRSYPYWSPDRDHEAATLLMRLLEAEKAVS